MQKTKITTVSNARTNLYKLIDETAEFHEPVLISGKRNNAVLIGEEDWNAILETVYLNGIPGFTESIKEEKGKGDDEFLDEIEW